MLKRIKKLRIKNNYSILELANYLEISEKDYLSLESGEKNPTIFQLSKLARFFCTSIDYILEETDEFTPYKKN